MPMDGRNDPVRKLCQGTAAQSSGPGIWGIGRKEPLTHDSCIRRNDAVDVVLDTCGHDALDLRLAKVGSDLYKQRLPSKVVIRSLYGGKEARKSFRRLQIAKVRRVR